jgi:hypothetical protein
MGLFRQAARLLAAAECGVGDAGIPAAPQRGMMDVITASRSAPTPVPRYDLRLTTAGVGGLAGRSWRNATSADPQWLIFGGHRQMPTRDKHTLAAQPTGDGGRTGVVSTRVRSPGKRSDDPADRRGATDIADPQPSPGFLKTCLTVRRTRSVAGCCRTRLEVLPGQVLRGLAGLGAAGRPRPLAASKAPGRAIPRPLTCGMQLPVAG